MTKLIPLLLLCGTAAADPPSPTLNLGFDLTNGSDTRHYALKLVDKACGDVEAKTRTTEDQIKVCVESDTPKATKLSIDWRTRNDDREVSNHSTVIAARGGWIDFDGPGVKLKLTLQ